MKFLKAISIFFTGVAAPVVVANAATLVKESPGVIGEKHMHVQCFEMDGHTYIYFIEKGPGGLKQILHDPGCKCITKQTSTQRLTGPAG